MSIILSEHVKVMLEERNISEIWVWDAINDPDLKETGNDNNLHYYKSIKEYGNRILHIVVNSNISPNKVVTAFFDRRRLK